jgi:hypothetical protein
MTLQDSLVLQKNALISELQAEIDRLTQYDFTNCSCYKYDKIEERVAENIDECNSSVEILGITFSASRIVMALDSVAFSEAVSEVIDADYVEHDEKYYSLADLEELTVDVRLCYRDNVHLELHFGLVDYDTDHKGLCAATTIDYESDAKEALSELIFDLVYSLDVDDV